MRVGKFALITPVMTSTEGRCVAMIRWMPAARAILREALDEALDLLARDHHQIGQFVDETTMRGSSEVELLFLVGRLSGLGVVSRSGPAADRSPLGRLGDAQH